MTPGPPVVVVLAAGASSRLGRCKALEPLGPDAEDHALSRYGALVAALGLRDAVLVTGADDRLLRAACPPGLACVHNAAWRTGRLESVRAAIRARPGRDVLLVPVDVPRVTRPVFQSLLAAWTAADSPEQGWLAPFVLERRDPTDGDAGRRFGHPVVVGRALAAAIARSAPRTPESLRDWRARATPLLAVEVHDPGILEDLDTPEDARRIRGESVSDP